MTFDQWWDKETEAVGRKGVGRNGVFYQLAKRAWVAAERKEREACAHVCLELASIWLGDPILAGMSDGAENCAAAIREGQEKGTEGSPAAKQSGGMNG